jgi:uncharacterized phage-associated protein
MNREWGYLSVFCSISGIVKHFLFPDYILKWVYTPVLNMVIYNYVSRNSHSAELKFKSVQMKKWRKTSKKILGSSVTHENV